MVKLGYSLLFILVIIAQLAVPAHMIYEQEATLKNGTAYKFKTKPIDPSDPFRGKYITLNYEIDSFDTEINNWKYNMDIYVYLQKDKDGFAKVKNISKKPLDNTDDYVIARSYGYYSGSVNFEFPFNRFYMNENKAYDAEVSVRKAQRDTLLTCYALVHIKEDKAVLKDVIINNTPIQKYVEKYQETRKETP